MCKLFTDFLFAGKGYVASLTRNTYSNETTYVSRNYSLPSNITYNCSASVFLKSSVRIVHPNLLTMFVNHNNVSLDALEVLFSTIWTNWRVDFQVSGTTRITV